MKVKVYLEEKEAVLQNVTNVKCDLCFDMFTNKIEIKHDEKKTTFNEFEITGMEIVEQPNTKTFICDIYDMIYCVTKTVKNDLGVAVKSNLDKPVAKKVKSITIGSDGVKYHVKNESYSEETFNKDWFLSLDKAKEFISKRKD